MDIFEAFMYEIIPLASSLYKSGEKKKTNLIKKLMNRFSLTIKKNIR